MMEHLPPVGWADVATKRDLGQLRHELFLGMRAMLTLLLTVQQVIDQLAG